MGNDASLLEDEIFGPILPIVTYKTINEAIAYINTKERPLALYIYSKSKNEYKTITKQYQELVALVLITILFIMQIIIYLLEV